LAIWICLQFCFANAFISQIKRKQCILSQAHNSIAMISLKNLICTLAGFEPGSSDPEADAMSTAPSRQPIYNFTFILVFISQNKMHPLLSLKLQEEWR
jgi:hypothetical protein